MYGMIWADQTYPFNTIGLTALDFYQCIRLINYIRKEVYCEKVQYVLFWVYG